MILYHKNYVLRKTPGPFTAMYTETLDPNTITNYSAANSVIKNTLGVFDGRNSPTSILSPAHPTPEIHINEEPYD